MGKDREEKILEEIRKRVLAADNKKRTGEEEDDLRYATRAALSEVTSLSRQEVDLIADSVRSEFRRKRRIMAFICAGVILVVFLAGAIVAKNVAKNILKPRPFLDETFDDAQRGWETGEVFNYNRYFKNGEYIFQSNKDGWCYWDKAEVSLPPAYTVELKSGWKSGTYGEYGLMLMDISGNYLAFQLQGDGTVSHAIRYKDKWALNDKWVQGYASSGDGNAFNIQKVNFNKGEYEYFINGRLFKKGRFDLIRPSSVALRVCGEQTIGFDNLRITTKDTAGKETVIMDEPFDNPGTLWAPHKTFLKSREFKDGKYVFTGNKKDWCYWSSIDMPLEGKYDVWLKSIWLKGEQANYGLMLIEDGKNYVSFEMKNNGDSRFTIYKNGKYIKISTDKKLVDPGDGEISNIQHVRVEGTRFKYYVNDKPVESWNLENIKVKKVGVRVCGRQTVAFDRLKIE